MIELINLCPLKIFKKPWIFQEIKVFSRNQKSSILLFGRILNTPMNIAAKYLVNNYQKALARIEKKGYIFKIWVMPHLHILAFIYSRMLVFSDRFFKRDGRTFVSINFDCVFLSKNRISVLLEIFSHYLGTFTIKGVSMMKLFAKMGNGF